MEIKNYILIVFILLSHSYSNQNRSKTPHSTIDLDQFDLETDNLRNETELLNFIESTMDSHLIPGLSISIAKGGNIVWENHFGYKNINENNLVDENTMFILSSASKAVTAALH